MAAIVRPGSKAKIIQSALYILEARLLLLECLPMSRDTFILGEVRPGPVPCLVFTQTKPLNERILKVLCNGAEEVVVNNPWDIVDDAL